MQLGRKVAKELEQMETLWPRILNHNENSKLEG